MQGNRRIPYCTTAITPTESTFKFQTEKSLQIVKSLVRILPNSDLKKITPLEGEKKKMVDNISIHRGIIKLQRETKGCYKETLINARN